MKTIAILGAGSWGTALALAAARNRHTVNLWEFDAKNCQAMTAERANNLYLPGVKFPDNIKIFNNFSEAIANVDGILTAVPSQFFENTLQQFPAPPQNFAWATKGLVAPGKLLSDVVTDNFGKISCVAISGPTFAQEVAMALPSYIVAAGENSEQIKFWQEIFTNKLFTVVASDDIVGVQIGGVIKNVIAVAVGICDGLNYGANARAALITKGFAEMQELGRKLGAKDATLCGFSGLGDLILTCTDNQSRNRRFGLALAKSGDIKQALAEVKQVVEGYHNAQQLHHLAKQHNLHLPVADQIYEILFNHKDLINFEI